MNETIKTSGATSHLVEVNNLSISFKMAQHSIDAVRGVSFYINHGETVAIVGESGSGKSISALSILQLLPYPKAYHPSGSILVEGKEIIGASDRILQSIRGNKISMIFQEPMTSLNPLHTIQRQISETLFLHRGMNKGQAKNRVLELLDIVGIKEPNKRLESFPHQLSGGQRQRVMIAMALANEPDLLIADEPTTAVDVTIQAQILDLLQDLQTQLGMSILMITHELGIVRKLANRIYVMKDGNFVEQGLTDSIFANPQHEYTKILINSEPKKMRTIASDQGETLVEVKNLKVHFPIKSGLFRKTIDHIRAIDDIDISIQEGNTLGVVGESGSGKTTLGLSILRLIKSEGSIKFRQNELQGLSFKQIRGLRREMQIVFQDPFGSLSPRLSMSQIVEEGLEVHFPDLSRNDRREQVAEVFKDVGIDPSSMDRYPHEFSGGQRQRISIARALVLKPKLIVLDAPTSALDRTVQVQILELLHKLRERYKLTYIFISHDLKVVRSIADQVIVMRDGKIVEYGNCDDVLENPRTDYAKALVKAAFDLTADLSGSVKN